MFAPNFGGLALLLAVLLAHQQLVGRWRPCRAAQHDETSRRPAATPSQLAGQPRRFPIYAGRPQARAAPLIDSSAQGTSRPRPEPTEFSTDTVPYDEVCANSTWENFKRAHGVSLSANMRASELFLKSIFVYSFLYAHELRKAYPKLFDRIEMTNFVSQPEAKLLQTLESISSLFERQWAAYTNSYSQSDTNDHVAYRQAMFSINLLRYNLDAKSSSQFKCNKNSLWDTLIEERLAGFKVCGEEPDNCGLQLSQAAPVSIYRPPA